MRSKEETSDYKILYNIFVSHAYKELNKKKFIEKFGKHNITHRDGALAQLASAPGLGPGGRRFESFHPDHIKTKIGRAHV